MMYLFDNFGMRWNIFKIIKHILFFYHIAYIGEAGGERYGIIFVSSCGVLAALAILPVVIDSFKKGKTTQSEES